MHAEIVVVEKSFPYAAKQLEEAVRTLSDAKAPVDLNTARWHVEQSLNTLTHLVLSLQKATRHVAVVYSMISGMADQEVVSVTNTEKEIVAKLCSEAIRIISEAETILF